jgi:histidine triad (HIT) family protein
MKTCLFCRIAAGDEPAEIVIQTDHAVGFLDHRPLFPGHVLLVPRRHIETLSELSNDLIEPLFAAAKLLSRAVPAAMGAQGSFVAMNNTVSQSVPHLHIHVVPRRKGDGLKGFFWPRHKYGEGEMAAAAGAIRAELEKLGEEGG